MYLNLYMISRWLKGVIDRQLSSNPMAADLTGVSPLYPGIILRSGVIYVGSASDLRESLPYSKVWLWLLPDSCLKNGWAKERMIFWFANEHLSVPYLIDQIQQIIQRYTPVGAVSVDCFNFPQTSC